MPNRKLNAGNYSYGFNGQIQDTEWMGGQSVAFEFRTQDARLGRFLSTDPLTALTPWETPYAFAANSPVALIDWLGLKAGGPPVDKKKRKKRNRKGKGRKYRKKARQSKLKRDNVNSVTLDEDGVYTVTADPIRSGDTASDEIIKDAKNNVSLTGSETPLRDGTYVAPAQYSNDRIAPADYSIPEGHNRFYVGDKYMALVDRHGNALSQPSPLTKQGYPPIDLISGPGIVGKVPTLLGAARTATQVRNASGYASGLGKTISGRWLKGSSGNAAFVPKVVADGLRGRTFNRFSDLQTAIWLEVGKHPKLLNQFNKGNQNQILKGNAPFSIVSEQSKRLPGQAGKRYNIHHNVPISQGGGVYDIDNLIIVTPKTHMSKFHPIQ